MSLFPPLTDRARFILLRIIQWAGGLSLSSVILIFIAFVTTIILRRKGYGVRLGLACIILYARPGSRRFPDGCEVRISTRVVGYIFGGFRGPWLDIYAERFYMRLRPTVTVTHPQGGGFTARRLLRLLRVYVYSVGIAAVESGYWSILCRNIVTRVVAFVVRGLRVRVEKVRVWKDGGSWEYKAEQFVFAGRAAGVFGSRYSLSVNELYINVCKTSIIDSHLYPPVNATLSLKRGVEIIAFLTPRFFTLLRPRRIAIMDDLKISCNVTDISCTAPRVLDTTISQLSFDLSPGYTKALAAKLPLLGPVSTRPRKPSVLSYWLANGTVQSVALRFTTPMASRDTGRHEYTADGVSLPVSVADSFGGHAVMRLAPQVPENGVFMRVDTIKLEAFGKAGDERHEHMTRASINVRGCSAGSMAVDTLSHALYESMALPDEGGRPDSDNVESLENVDKIVAARPEALVWIEDVTAAVDMNCSRKHATRVDIAGHGGILAIEPEGLAGLISDMRDFISKYVEKKPKRAHSNLTLDTESISSMARTSSGSSLQSSDGEQQGIRLVSDLRHWTVMALGHGPVGDGDTMALVASSESLVLPQVDIEGGSVSALVGNFNDLKLLHWTQWARTTNLLCKQAKFEIHRQAEKGKKLSFENTSIDWDLDLQSGLENLPELFASLKRLKRSEIPLMSSETPTEGGIPGAAHIPRGPEKERAQLTETERRERRERRHKKLLKSLSNWEMQGSDVSLNIAFPDGPKMGVSIGELPLFSLGAESFLGRHVVVSMQDTACAYGAELQMDSPLHTMNRNIEKRKIDIEIQGLCLVLPHGFQFGYLLQDWLLRLRSLIKVNKETKLRKRGIPVEQTKRRPLPDIRFKSSDVEIYFEDHPLGGFLTRMLPLFQDETRERLVREQVMEARIQQLHRIARAEIAGTAKRCLDELKKSDSKIWIDRVKALKKATPEKLIANGYLPSLKVPPVSTFMASSLSFCITMSDLVRERGSAESIRWLKMLDDYELGSKKHNKTRQHDSDAWNSIGFRAVDLEAADVRLQLKDYPVLFAAIDRMRFENTIVGQAVQATLPPYVAETTVAIAKRRVVKVVKGLGPTKTYADIHLVIDTLQCGFNPAYLGAIGDFARSIGRFFAGGKNPSPRIPWFDTLRVNMHGRMKITAKKLKGHLTSSTSPYSMTRHFVNVDADNFEMLTSRLQHTEKEPFPVCWTLRNWRITPSQFDAKYQSEVVFELVRVGLQPHFSVQSGDPQDHYFVPFPSKEQIIVGGPGIGRGTATLLHLKDPVEVSDNGFGNYTKWWTGLHNIANYDSFESFKTRTMILGIDVLVRHAESRRSQTQGLTVDSPEVRRLPDWYAPPGASVVHSDAVTTLIKVIKKLIRRPISCRLSPRNNVKQRRPPSTTGLSTALIGLNVRVDVKNLNVMMYNNLERGHGLFISVTSVLGELRKRTEIERLERGGVKRTSQLTRRRFTITDMYSSIRVPGLDMAVDAHDMGKLLTVDKISLSDDPKQELNYIVSPTRKGFHQSVASGFGSDDLSESPFYTFSANHPLQRGAKLDKVAYDKRLLVDGVRLIWSPVRRASLFAWPDAFKEKVFCMKAPKVDFSRECEVSTDSDEEQLDDLDGIRTNFASSIAEMLNDDGQNIPELNISEIKSPREDIDRRSEAHSTQDSVGVKSFAESTVSRGYDPLSPPLLSMSRSKSSAVRRPTGSMADLLTPYQTSKSRLTEESQSNPEPKTPQGDTASTQEVLSTKPKFALYINDCQVAFGSPETSGTVFLTSNAVRVGIVDKTIQKKLQFGESNERWSDREYRFHLNEANLYTKSKTSGDMDLSGKEWIPSRGKELEGIALVTRRPICMDLMYISSSSLPSPDGEEEDHILRPSLLFINIPDISMSTNADEFHAVVDVVRKVLMQSMRSSEVVNEELNNLRYKLQLAGGKVSCDELHDFIRRLNNVTKQFLYAGDTFQEELVDELKLPNESSFASTLLRYKAKAKAVATFMRQDQKAGSTDVLYPTMYISYSFDKCSWELREKQKDLNKETEHPFVELTLDDLVCRHIFYVGRGSTTEMTFGNISAQNKIKSSYFQGILQPASTGTNRNKSRIKASDGAPVAFRWYSIQDHRVGGISVYELLTIQVAPMTAALTRKLWSSVAGFIFSARAKEDSDGGSRDAGPRASQDARRNTTRGNTAAGSGNGSADSKNSSGGEWSSGARRNGAQTSTSSVVSRGGGELTNMDDLSQMARRGESSMLFKYVFIDAFELTASFKNKENSARGVLDFFDLFVTTPSFSYSSQIWTWKAFSTQIRKDLVMTFARRGVSNLAKIKLLPGYSRARRRFAQHTDRFRESLSSLVPTVGGNGAEEGESGSQENDVGAAAMERLNEEIGGNGGLEHRAAVGEHSSSDADEEDSDERIDVLMADISGARGRRRETILKALYGEGWGPGIGGVGRMVRGSEGGSVSSGEGFRARGLAKPPIPPTPAGVDRARTPSTPSRGSLDEDWGRGKVRLFRRLRRRAHELKEQVDAEMEESRAGRL